MLSQDSPFRSQMQPELLSAPPGWQVPIPASFTELQKSAIAKHLKLLPDLGTDEAVSWENLSKVFLKSVNVVQLELVSAEPLDSFENFVEPRAG